MTSNISSIIGNLAPFIGRKMTTATYNALFLSDIHLGYKDCKADYLIDFLNNNHAKTIYLIGDIVDIWSLKKQFYWPASHNAVLSLLIEKSRTGTKIVYIPGNHDEDLKAYCGGNFNDIEVAKRYTHTTISGKKMLLLHGDDFDEEVCLSRFSAKLGDHLYDLLLFMNRHFNRLRRRFGYHYWSLAAHIKSKVPKAKEVMTRYKNAAVKEAKKLGYDGVICGHIHHPEVDYIDDIMYCNDGDWIESCTALVETHEGKLELVHWSDMSIKLALIDTTNENGAKSVVQLPEKAA